MLCCNKAEHLGRHNTNARVPSDWAQIVLERPWHADKLPQPFAATLKRFQRSRARRCGLPEMQVPHRVLVNTLWRVKRSGSVVARKVEGLCVTDARKKTRVALENAVDLRASEAQPGPTCRIHRRFVEDCIRLEHHHYHTPSHSTDGEIIRLRVHDDNLATEDTVEAGPLNPLRV